MTKTGEELPLLKLLLGCLILAAIITLVFVMHYLQAAAYHLEISTEILQQSVDYAERYQELLDSMKKLV